MLSFMPIYTCCMYTLVNKHLARRDTNGIVFITNGFSIIFVCLNDGLICAALEKKRAVQLFLFLPRPPWRRTSKWPETFVTAAFFPNTKLIDTASVLKGSCFPPRWHKSLRIKGRLKRTDEAQVESRK